MSMRSRYMLAGIALILGGLMGGLCHLLDCNLPADLTQLAQYERYSEPLHLSIFAGGTLVLLGWFGEYALHCSNSGRTALAAFLLLFLGILFGDLLHCILEFSVFPILALLVPYALPGLVASTYQSTPVATLTILGHLLTLLGLVTTALSVHKGGILRAWVAFPFMISAILSALELMPQIAIVISQASSTAVYLSMACLGVAVICEVRANPRRSAGADFNAVPICREEFPPAGQSAKDHAKGRPG